MLSIVLNVLGCLLFFFYLHISKGEEWGNFTAAEKQKTIQNHGALKAKDWFCSLISFPPRSQTVCNPQNKQSTVRLKVLWSVAGGLGPSLSGADECRLWGERWGNGSEATAAADRWGVFPPRARWAGSANASCTAVGLRRRHEAGCCCPQAFAGLHPLDLNAALVNT